MKPIFGQRFFTWAGILLFAALVAILFIMTGCGTETRQETRTERRTVTVSKTITQQITPNGDIVQLESVTRTTTDETGQQIGESQTEIKPPQIVGSLSKAVGTGVALLTGSGAAGQAAEAGIDWLTGLIGAGATGAVGAGTGAVAMRRLERSRTRQLVQAQDDYASDIEDAETDAEVAEIKRKHAERQKALGIHEQLTRERHGV
jgi:hypothetical protein